MAVRVKHKSNSSPASCPLPTGSSPTELPNAVTELSAVIAKTAASSFDSHTLSHQLRQVLSFYTCTRTIPWQGRVFWSSANIVLSGTLTDVNKESTNINTCASDNRVCHFVSIINAAQFSGSWIFCCHLHTRGACQYSWHWCVWGEEMICV